MARFGSSRFGTAQFGSSDSGPVTPPTPPNVGPLPASPQAELAVRDIGSYGIRLYGRLEPMQYDEHDQDYALLKYIGATGEMFQDIEDLVRDQDGKPGWSQLIDLDRTPDRALRWLGQFIGVTIPANVDAVTARAMIRAHLGWNRGTPQAMRDALSFTLTGEKHVIFIERDGSAYRLTVITRTSETPSTLNSYMALLSQKPAGLSLNYIVAPGRTWLEVRMENAIWGDARSRYINYEDMRGTYPTAAPGGTPLAPSDTLAPDDSLAPGG